ncbi:MAG: alpha/beta fold hydrolase [Xanthomonadaceae bacterium]|nr:alpha/beta fold hydrolase [Xanthomonadaceae bacterium]
MRLLSSLPIALVVAMLPTLTVCAAEVPSPACMAHAGASLDALTHGDYVGARKDFSDDLASKADAVRLKQVWKQVQDAYGARHYQSHDALRQTVLDGHAMAVATLSFTNMRLGFVAACDAQGRITHFRFVPAKELASMSVQARVEAGGVRVAPLDVPTPVGPLHGALTLPPGAGPFPAVVMVGGSGPDDLDETIGANKPFRDIAEGLARAGIASLRYDKRTFDHPEAGAGLVVDTEVTNDAVMAAQLLARQKEIDPKRVFLLGHSLGAMMAPRIGQRDPQLAGLVLLAAPARPLLDVSAEQARVLGARAHEAAAQITGDEQAISAEQKLLAAADPRHPPAGSFGGLSQGYWMSLYDYHQVAVAKALSTPMLILQGAGDFQVSPTLDFARWQRELAGRPHTKFRLYPDLDHQFIPVGKTGTPIDYNAMGHVDAQVIADIAAWVKAQTAR